MMAVLLGIQIWISGRENGMDYIRESRLFLSKFQVTDKKKLTTISYLIVFRGFFKCAWGIFSEVIHSRSISHSHHPNSLFKNSWCTASSNKEDPQ